MSESKSIGEQFKAAMAEQEECDCPQCQFRRLLESAGLRVRSVQVLGPAGIYVCAPTLPAPRSLARRIKDWIVRRLL